MISILLQIRIWVVPHISTSLMLLEVDAVFIEQANDAVRIWLPKRLPSLAIQCALLLFSIKWILTDAVDDRWIITVQTLNYPITFKQSSLKVFFVKWCVWMALIDVFIDSVSYTWMDRFRFIIDSKGLEKILLLPKALDLDRPKRSRTAFAKWQLDALETTFGSHPYLVGEQRTLLARRLGLSETQVDI